MKRTSSWLAVAAVTFVLLEVVLRLSAVLPQTAPDYVADAEVGYRARPDHRHGAVVTDARGYNDASATPPADAGRPLLAFVGDSFTFGSYPYPLVFPHLTAAELAAAGLPCRARNMGIPGASPWQYAAVIRHDLHEAERKPAVIVATVYVGNDIVQANPHFSTRLWFGGLRMLPEPRAFGLSTEYFYTFKLGRAALRNAGDLLAPEPEDPFLRTEHYALPTYAREPASYVRDGYAGMKAALAAMADAARSVGAPLVVALAPARIQIDPAFRDLVLSTFAEKAGAYDFARPQAVIAGYLTAADIPFIDLRDALSDAPADYYRPGDIHWNEAGNGVVAEAIAAFLAPRLSGSR